MVRSLRVLTIFARCCFFLSALSAGPALKPGQLTPDYGILSDTDIQKITRQVVPSCWAYDPSCPTNYWECGPIDRVELRCDESGTLHDGTVSYLPVLSIDSTDFHTRRPWTKENCEEDLSTWTTIIADQDLICIAAMLPTEEPVNGRYNRQMDRIKTFAGEWSYFID